MKIIVVYQAKTKLELFTGHCPFEVPKFPLSEKEFYEVRQYLMDLNKVNELVILNLIPLRED